MTSSDRKCSLVIDEMAIKGHLDYNKRTDSIHGLTPDGQKARQAMVFMARGISGKWKQVVPIIQDSGQFRVTVACVKGVSEKY